MPETITGSNKLTVFRSDTGYTVCRYALNNGTSCTVVGQLPDMKDVTFKVTGEWITDKKYGRQFKASSYEIVPPNNEKGIVAYFVSLKCGIGSTWAKRIYNKFGTNTWDILENEPERLLEINKFGEKRLKVLKNKISETKVIRNIMSLFSGISEVTTQKAELIAKELGNSAVNEIKENPYNLCKVKGLSFTAIEKIAAKFDGKPDDLLRIQACVMHILERMEVKGHTCIPENMLIKQLYKMLNSGFGREMVSKEICVSSLKYLIKSKKCCEERYIKGDGNEAALIYLRKSYISECGIAKHIKRIIGGTHISLEKVEEELIEYDSLNTFKLAEIQKQAVITSLQSHFSVITGGPGTGKTTITKAILYLHNKLCKDSKPMLLAPTGRAARKLSNTTGYEASTIHSAIGLVHTEEGEVYTSVDQIDANLIIIDETSMLDQYVAYHLFKIIPDNAVVIIIGDSDQLPSVGAGNVLLDIINSGVIPVTKLGVIFRQEQDSPIIYNSKAVLEGNTELMYGKGFCFQESDNEQTILKDTCKFYLACVKKFGIDNVCLLTPLRKESDLLSVASFNKHLQPLLNPAFKGDTLTMEVHGTQFHKGDKVMQMRNTSNAKNGDIGYIKDICYKTDEKGDFTTVCVNEFEGKEVEYDKDNMRNVELAYASTIHKVQGSEYKTIIIVVSNTHKIALKSNLIYTAITRATDNVAIIGQKEALEYAICNDETDRRNTYLKQRLTVLLKDSVDSDSVKSIKAEQLTLI